MPKITLEFEFDEDNGPFSINSTEMIFVYQSVMSAIELPDTLHNCMLTIWLDGQRKGDPKLSIAALSPLANLSIWKWPSLEDWRKRFKKEARLPASWERMELAAKSWPNPWHARRMLLLSETLTSAVYSRREFLQWQTPYRSGKDWEYQRQLCPVEQSVAEEHRSTVSMSDWTTWPPFFPGDSSRPALKLPARST